ncbi:MAG: hypothetical protein ACYC26_02145 [Phycisphaerales bacterium]
MTVKETARQIIDRLPDDASIEDVINALYVRAKFEAGEQQIKQNRGIPHEQARQRIAKWVK